MKSTSITIKDIARALSLSYSTVARALKDSYMISEPIREKVKAYAAENNYKPNLMAQSLRLNRSRTIGLILPAIPNSFFSEVISGIESVAYDKDYKVIITQSFESYEREVNNLEFLKLHSADGILVSLSTETTDVNHFKKLKDDGYPLVFFDRITNLIDTHTVSVDNHEGAYKATLHLIESGYRSIGHITSSPESFISKERLSGYKKALHEKEIPFRDDLVKYCLHGGMTAIEMEKAIKELLLLEPRPDALLTASDRITLGTLNMLDKLQIKIPDQMAIAGFSNFSAPQLFNPSLTTVRQPAFDMGKKAIELLIELIEGKHKIKSFEKIILPTELMVRKSSLKKI